MSLAGNIWQGFCGRWGAENMEYRIEIREDKHKVVRSNSDAFRYQFWDDVITMLKIVYGMKLRDIEREVTASLKRIFPEQSGE